MCLDTEDRLCEFASVETNEMATLRCKDQIVLHRWVPLDALNILVKWLIKLMPQ